MCWFVGDSDHWLLLRLGLDGLRDLIEDEVAITAEPVRHRYELLPLGLVEPHPAAALMIHRRDREGGQEPTQGEILDALIALLHLLPSHGQTCMLDGEPDALDHQRGNEDAPVVVHPTNIVRYILMRRLVHLKDLPEHRKVPPHPGKLQAQ